MVKAFLIYPHQLFETILSSKGIQTVVLVEDPLFFSQFSFHQKKLIFHRATMQSFASRLREKGFKVKTISASQLNKTEDIVPLLQQMEIKEIHLFDLVDDWLQTKLYKSCKEANIQIKEQPSPNFLISKEEIQQRFPKEKKPLMATFYKAQRIQFDLLVENGKPVGGQWSFDKENRKKLPKNFPLPPSPKINDDPCIEEAKSYVKKEFSSYLDDSEGFFYPINHSQARSWLDQFFEERFSLFGPFEDAIAKEHSILFHSLLSPLLNVGLLTPQEVLEKAIKQPVNIQTLEGFVRQILGWREYIRAIYQVFGREERTKNFFQHHRKIPSSFWTGTTGIFPIDNVIAKVRQTAYAHHIERLMVMSNFMLLCEFDPDEVYRWFMEFFIDAYDWVMVPNVYGMGLFADGGVMSTKPYITSSNYLLKMGNYPKGAWTEVWDALYWNFISKHKAFFKNNPRTQPMVFLLEKMDASKLQAFQKKATSFLESF